MISWIMFSLATKPFCRKASKDSTVQLRHRAYNGIACHFEQTMQKGWHWVLLDGGLKSFLISIQQIDQSYILFPCHVFLRLWFEAFYNSVHQLKITMVKMKLQKGVTPRRKKIFQYFLDSSYFVLNFYSATNTKVRIMNYYTQQEVFLVSLCPAWFHKMHYSVLAACLLSRCHDLGEKVSNNTVQKMFMYKRPVYLEWAYFK